jgi:xanthosine utilization system XapX-like protein
MALLAFIAGLLVGSLVTVLACRFRNREPDYDPY